MDLLDIRRLQAFAEVARHGSFRLAAVSMGLSQPTISRQILALEEDLGVVLLQRGGKGTKVTEAGALLLDRARLHIADLRETRAQVESCGSSPAGVVTIAVLTSFSAAYSVPLLDRLEQRLPDVRVRLTEGTSRIVERRLFDGEAELGVLIDGPLSANLIREELLSEDFHLFGRQLPTAAAGAVSLKEIAAYPLVLPPPPHGTRRLIEEAARRQGVSITPRFEVDSPYLIRDLMLSRDVYAILPRTAVPAERQAGLLKALPIHDGPQRTLVLGTMRGEPLSAAARSLAREIGHMMRHAEQVGPAPRG